MARCRVLEPAHRPAALMALAILLGGACAPLPSPSEPDLRPDRAARADADDVASFEAAWRIIRDTHFDTTFNGIDWDALRQELLPRVLEATGSDEVRRVIHTMVARLGQSHFGLIPAGPARSGADAGVEPSASGSPQRLEGPEPGRAEPGFDVLVLDGRVVVSRVREGSPASDTGVQSGWVLKTVDGRPVPYRRRADAGTARLRVPTALRGSEADSVDLIFLDGTDRRVELSVGRWREPGSSVAFAALGGTLASARTGLIELDSGHRVGTVGWNSWSGSLMDDLHRALDDFRDTDGIVLDLRRNGGGFGAMVMGVAGHFFDSTESLGTWRTRGGVLHFTAQPRRVDVAGVRRTAFKGPVAILVDELSGSTSEVFAAGMQGLGRARVFGRRTAGQVLPATVDLLPNGDRLLHAVADFTTVDGRRLEGRGVNPDEVITPTREDLLQRRDPVLEAALRWIAARVSTDSTPLR